MNEFNFENPIVPELLDLEDVRAKNLELENRLRANNFSTSEERLTSECEFVARIKKERAIATNSEVQDRVAFMAKPAVNNLVALIITPEIEDDTPEPSLEEKLSALEIVKQGIRFFKEYGAHTEEAKALKRDMDTKINIKFDEPSDPLVEILDRKQVSVSVDSHYIVGSDGNLTRILKDITETDSKTEGAYVRALGAVLESYEGLNAEELFAYVYGKGEKFESKKIKPVIEWMRNIPMHDGSLVVSVGVGKNTKLYPSPRFDVDIDDLEVSDTIESEFRSDPEKTITHLEDMCVIVHHLHGFNQVLKDYGQPIITDGMLDALERYVPEFVTQDQIKRNRDYAFKELISAMASIESTRELVYNIQEVSLGGDKAAKAADKFLQLLETTKGRELLRLLAKAEWDEKRGLQDGGFTVRDRKLLDSAGKEVWPNLLNDLVIKK